jgi:thioredoxin-dependent peroxiredoxin
VQLTSLAEDYDKFKQAGADLVAISTDAQNYAWSMSQTTGARYQILSDSDHKVIESYGVLNPREHGGIAHPSAFLIDKEGVIRYAYVGKNPTDRPPDQTLIEEIKKLSAPK